MKKINKKQKTKNNNKNKNIKSLGCRYTYLKEEKSQNSFYDLKNNFANIKCREVLRTLKVRYVKSSKLQKLFAGKMSQKSSPVFFFL